MFIINYASVFLFLIKYNEREWTGLINLMSLTPKINLKLLNFSKS